MLTPSAPPANGADEHSLARLEDHTSPPPVATPAPTPIDALEPRIRRIEEALDRLLEQRTAQTHIATQPAPAPAPTAVFVDVGKRLLSAAASVATPAPAPAPASGTGLLWLLRDTWAEARAIVRMFVDPRYHLPLSARVLPWLVLAAILTSKYWVPGSSIPFLGDWLLVKLVDLLLAFVLFKWLGHEARRYRQSSPDLPPSLRL